MTQPDKPVMPAQLTRALIEKIDSLPDDGGEGCPWSQDELDIIKDALRASLPPPAGEKDDVPERVEDLDIPAFLRKWPDAPPAEPGEGPEIVTVTIDGEDVPMVSAHEHYALLATVARLRERDEVATKYATAARVIGLYLDEFCDKSLPYDEMIAEAARKAAPVIRDERLRAESAERRAEAWRGRYEWLADKVIAPDYGDNPWRSEGKGKGYWIKHCKGPSWIEGKTLDAAIDAARQQDKEPK